MQNVDYYIPTRIVFGAGRLNELATLSLPGKKALICVTEDKLMEKLGIQQRVLELLGKNQVAAVVFDKVQPNPTSKGIMAAVALAKKEGCDFIIGLGGGSSIDTAKGVAIMMANPGDIWDYCDFGTGGRKKVDGACPVVAISTTAGTGTETDPYAVVTNEETGEKFDFAVDDIFPRISIIDPELTLSLPGFLTLSQGFDALFHSAECYVSNGNKNRLIDLYATEAVRLISENLKAVLDDGNNIEARGNIAFAADVLGGFVQSLVFVTSHHLVGQALGGLFPKVPHGVSLIVTAKAYYSRVYKYLPKEFDDIGEIMGVKRDPANPGAGFVAALTRLMQETGADKLKMSDYGVTRDKLAQVAHNTFHLAGLDCDRYKLTEQDLVDILEESFA